MEQVRTLERRELARELHDTVAHHVSAIAIQAQAGRAVAAICAAPIALRTHGVFEGARMTCHPSVNEVVGAHGRLTTGAVVTDGQLITSQGPGTAFLFALAIVERLRGADVAEKVRRPMMLPA